MKRIVFTVPIILWGFLSANALQNVIKNKEQREAKIELAKELTLGDSPGEKEPLWRSILSLRVDAEGNMYILDSKASKVIKFDSSGKLLFSFGQKGQGPGEIMVAAGIELGKNKTILIYDLGNRKIMYFSAATGEFLEERSTAKWLRLTRIDDNEQGFLYGTVTVYEQDKNLRILYRFSPDLNDVNEIYRVERRLLGKEHHMYEAVLLFRVLDDGRVFLANNQDYKIHLYSGTGDLLKTIQSDYRPVRIGEEDKKRELASRYGGAPGLKDTVFVFPDFYPPIDHLIVDNKENIYIRRFQKAKMGGTYYEVFNMKGKPLGKFALDFTLACVVDDKIYSMESNEEGLDQVCRYKYRLMK